LKLINAYASILFKRLQKTKQKQQKYKVKNLQKVTPKVALKAAEGDRLKGNSGWASAIYFLLER